MSRTNISNSGNSGSNSSSHLRHSKRDDALSRSMAQAAAAAAAASVPSEEQVRPRRRNMSFMKYSTTTTTSASKSNNNSRSLGNTGTTTTNTNSSNFRSSSSSSNHHHHKSNHTDVTASQSMTRTREHAKQIAMALQQQQPDDDDDVLFPSFAADFGSAFGGSTTTNHNNHNSSSASMGVVGGTTTTTTTSSTRSSHKQQQQQQHHHRYHHHGNNSEQQSVTESTTRSQDDLFGYDPFAAVVESNTIPPIVRQGSQAGSTATSISGSSSSRRRNNIRQQLISARTSHSTTTKTVHEQHQQDEKEDLDPLQVDWPSSTPQPSVVRVSALTASPVIRKAPRSTASSSSGGGGGGMTMAAATKLIPRRSAAAVPSQSAVSSSSSPLQPPHQSSTAAARRLMRQQMRAATTTTASDHRATDHVAHYSTTTTTTHPPMTQPAPHHHHRNATLESSDGSSASTTTTTTTTTKDVNHFLFDTHKSGFSFDAFGLDSAEMQREVNEAMNDLLVGHHGFMLAEDDDDDEFADTTTTTFGHWDDIPTPTTTTIKHPSTYNNNNNNMPSVRESPTRSERSSLTSESLEHNNTNHIHNNNNNMFQQQAGFPHHLNNNDSTNNQARRVVRPLESKSSKLDAHLAKGTFTTTSTAISPRQNHNRQMPSPPKVHSPRTKIGSIQQQPSVVEFFGEESSTDEEAFHHSSVHTKGGGTTVPHQRPPPPLEQNRRLDDTDAATDSEMADIDAPSDVGVSSDAGHSVIGHLPFMEIQQQRDDKHKKAYQKRTSSPSVRTESTAETTTADEKKDDDFHHHNVTSKVGNLRSQWESREQAIQKEAKERLIQRQNVPSTISKDHIERLQNQLGDMILSPELLTAQRPEYFEEPKIMRAEVDKQKERAQECFDQRTSLSSVKERLKSTATAGHDGSDASRRKSKSEGGAAVRHNSVNSILSNLQKKGLVVDSRVESPNVESFQRRPVNSVNGAPWSPARSNKGSTSVIRGNSSDIGTGFESQAMKLLRQQNDNMNSASRRKTPTNSGTPRKASTFESPSRNTTPRTGNNGSGHFISAIENEYSRDDNASPSMNQNEAPKQLTYRERRELELQRQSEEEAQKRANDHDAEPKKKDVSVLIRQRIAANKKNTVAPAAATHNHDSNAQPLDISSLRTRLRPTPVPTIASEETSISPQHEIYESQQYRPNQERPPTKANNAGTEIDTYDTDRTHDRTVSQPLTHSSKAQPNLNVTRDDTECASLRSPPRSQRTTAPKECEIDTYDADRTHDRTIDQPLAYGSKAQLNLDVTNDGLESASLRSPHRSQRTMAPKASDLVIDDDATTAPPMPGRVAANTAVSHMLMLQQLQQRQPKAPASIDTAGPETRSSTALSINTDNEPAPDEQKNKTPKATMMMLNAFLAGREALVVSDRQGTPQIQASRSEDEMSGRPGGNPMSPSSNLCALKDDPKYARYFKMLSIGMPMEVVKHAMTRDGLDASVMDNDHNKPVGIPLKDDPTYSKYFRMLKIGLPMEAVKHAMERDGLDSAIMDQDHDLPVASGKQSAAEEPKEQDSHRRARLHWKTLRKVTSNSLWAQIDQDNEMNIEIDEEEFQELFQAEKDEAGVAITNTTVSQKRGSSVCVIDSKRANNGGIILARLKMSHDDLADAVDRIDEQNLTGEQIENIIEYLPTKDERKALETYMLEGGQDAAEKFDGLCECEKFMVSMMTVKHAKRKVSALLFKLQFESCIQDIQKEACAIEQACEELSSSVRLRQLLGIILTFGNRLNTAGNGKRKAGAFTLDSLLKLNQAKAFDKKTTFLHYIILIVQRNNELLLNFKDDLPTVFASEKIFWDQCVSDLEEVENQLENVRKMALYQAHQAQSYRVRRKSKREDPDESLSDADEGLTLEEEVEALRSTPIGLFTLGAIKYVSALRDKVESTKIMYARVLEYFGEEEKQLQPHELFSIIVSFSRDFDKAKEQVFANERLKQREERKRQGTPGRPMTNSPALSSKKSGMLKASNMQPNMSAILDELKSNGKRIADMETDSTQLTPPQIQRSFGNQEMYSSNHGMSTHQNPHSMNHVEDWDRGTLPSPPLQSHQRRQYLEDPHARSLPVSASTPQLQKIEAQHMSRKSPTYGVESARSFNSDDANLNDDNTSQVTTETVNSSASTSSIAMRAKARMRRQRKEQLPSIPAMSPIGNGTTLSAPSPRTIHSEEAHVIAPPRSLDDTAQPLSPRSNMRMKRRADYRNKGRRSSSTNAANVQL